jgi:hypothetical protein
VRLLHEQSKGQQSELREWLQQLPRRVDSPVNWSQELVQQLQYSHLIHKVTEQQQEWSTLYDKFKEAAVNKGSAPSKQVGVPASVLQVSCKLNPCTCSAAYQQ